MAKVTGPLLSMEAAGTLGKLLTFTATGKGHRVYKFSPPRGTGDAGRKAHYAAGCAAWRALDEEGKQGYNESARPLKLTGFNLYMREYMNAYNLPSGTTWDGGSTTWDGGSTTWDVGL